MDCHTGYSFAGTCSPSTPTRRASCSRLHGTCRRCVVAHVSSASALTSRLHLPSLPLPVAHFSLPLPSLAHHGRRSPLTRTHIAPSWSRTRSHNVLVALAHTHRHAFSPACGPCVPLRLTTQHCTAQHCTAQHNTTWHNATQ